MQSSNREKNLVKNTGLLAIGTLSSKILTFFLLPLYTNVLTTSDYGIVDVLQTIASLLLPFATLQMGSGLFRYLVDTKSEIEKKQYISSGIFAVIVSAIAFAAGIFLYNVVFPFRYAFVFVLYFISLLLNESALGIARGLGDYKVYSIMSFLMTAVSLITNLLLILGLDFRGNSILIASTLAYMTASAYAFFRLHLWKLIAFSAFSKARLKEMLCYALPLIPNSISWWIANTSDRLLILYFMGSAANGIYAAANKIPAIYTTVFNVFNIAWMEALARNISDTDYESFTQKIYDKSIRLFCCINLLMISVMSIIFDYFIGNTYSEAYNHILILLFAILFNSMCSLLGGVFTAYKKSSIISKTTMYGAIVNILANVLLIDSIGLYAASVSTLISYIVIYVVRLKASREYIILRWNKTFLVEFLLVSIVVGVAYVVRDTRINLCVLIAVGIWTLYVNREMLSNILEILKKR